MLIEADRRRLLEKLVELSEKDFAEIVASAARHRRPILRQREGRPLLDSIGFALAYVSNVDDEIGPPRLVALPDKAVYGGSWSSDSPLCQSGECGECGSNLISWAKSAICPVCDSTVQLT